MLRNHRVWHRRDSTRVDDHHVHCRSRFATGFLESPSVCRRAWPPQSYPRTSTRMNEQSSTNGANLVVNLDDSVLFRPGLSILATMISGDAVDFTADWRHGSSKPPWTERYQGLQRSWSRVVSPEIPAVAAPSTASSKRRRSC